MKLIRPFRTEDYKLLCEWWLEWEWPAMPLEALPKTGFVALSPSEVPQAMAFMYHTDSNIAWMEWVTGNPNSSREDRGNAVNRVVQEVLDEAKKGHYRMVFTSVNHPKLLERLKTNGFVVSDKSMTNLVYPLGGA
jgi:hypothetical protein